MNHAKKSDILNALKNHIVKTEGISMAHELMQRSYDGAYYGGDSRSVLIVGESGTGKSCALRYFCEMYPPKRSTAGLKMPIVYANVPSKPTVKGLALVLINAIGDPNIIKRCTEQHLTFRLKKLIRKAGVRIIMLDEFQHFVDKGNEKVQYHVADWLKCLVDETGVNLVVSGLPSAISVMEINYQLKRRFMAPVIMPHYRWTNQNDREEFINFLCEMSELIAPCELPDLRNEEMAHRFYLATDGIIGRVVNLLCEVVINAFYYNKFDITLADLDIAALNASFDTPNRDLRPFSDDFLSKAG